MEKHQDVNWLSDAILGGQDGLVNVLGIVLGVSAAGGSISILIAAGMAATFAESVSMGAVAYTSTLARRDFYQKELERERYEIEKMPELERKEVEEIYKSKGFEGEILKKVVDTITAKKDVWLKIMMDEELHLQKVETSDALRSAVVVTIAAIVGSLIPISPFFFLPRDTALVLAIALGAVSLFSIGAYQAKIFVGNPFKNGIRMVVIGMTAALIGFIVGKIFHTI